MVHTYKVLMINIHVQTRDTKVILKTPTTHHECLIPLYEFEGNETYRFVTRSIRVLKTLAHRG